MKFNILIFIFFVFGQVALAQIDNRSGSGISIPASENNSSINSPLYTPGKRPSMSETKTFTPRNEEKPLKESKEKNFDMSTKNNGLMTKKFDYQPSWLTKDKEFNNKFYSEQLLGSFGTKSKTIEILCRDHQHVDGDRVSIILNDIVIVHNINLRADFQSFTLDLKEGRNVIQFQALNQGTSGPNTANFKVYDQNSNLITENEWNLATGVKANLVVIRE